MIRQVIWSPAAEKDFDNILGYLLKNWNQQVISKFINKIDDNINLIIEDPKIFPYFKKDLNIRRCVVSKQNTLYYRNLGDRLEIVRLFDNRQDPKELKF